MTALASHHTSRESIPPTTIQQQQQPNAHHPHDGIRSRLQNLTHEATNHVLASFRHSKQNINEPTHPPQPQPPPPQLPSSKRQSTSTAASAHPSQENLNPASEVPFLEQDPPRTSKSGRWMKDTAKDDPPHLQRGFFGAGPPPPSPSRKHHLPASMAGLAGNPVMAGFYFKRRTERLDWRLLASLQVERVQREVDIAALQEIMENITFCDVDSEDVRYVDPNFLKLFKISQLIIEYLVHTQDFLTDTQAVLSQDLQSTLDQLEVLTGKFEKQTTEFNAMKKENRNLKKTLYAYQLMARVPGYTGGGTGADGGGNEAASYHRCIHCTKVFKAAVFLENHILRRHPEVAPRPASPTSQNQNYHQQQQAYYQQQQQPHMMNQPNSPGQPGMFGGMFSGAFNPMMFGTNDFSQVVAAKIKESEASLRAEMEERMAKEIEAKQKAIQQKYEQERLKNESEIQHLKAEIHQQLSDERAQFEDEKIQLETIIKQQQKYNKRSRFGILEDDDGERDSLLPVKASDLKKEHDSVIASINAKFEEQMATMKKMFTEEKEQDKKELAEKLDKATSQISTLRTLLKQEHELNQTRDEEVKNLMKNQKKHGGFVTPVLATAATAAAAAAASMAFSHKSPTKPEQSPTDGPWKHIQDVPQNYSEPLGPPPPAQNTTDQSSAYGPWKAIKDVPQHPESAGDGNSKDRGIGGASMAETAIKMAMSAAGGGNNGGLTETAVKMAMSAMSGGQGGGGLAQTAVKMALSSTGGGHGGGGSDVESLAASALGLALGAGVAGGRPKSPLAEMASTALNMYMGGGVGNSPGPGVTPRGIESTPRSAGGGGDTDSSDDKPLSVLAAERKSETLETEGLKALQKVPSFTEKPRSRGGSLFKQSDGPRSRDISAPNGQEPQYQYPAFLTQPQPQDQTPQYQIPAFLPPPTGPLSFTDAMALMNSNQCTPLPACPWILTQYDQTVADISTQQKEIMKQVDAELVRYGINENTVLDQWQDERVKQDVKKKWTSFQKETIVAKDTRIPLYKDMRVYIDSKITEVAKKNFKLKLKPVAVVPLKKDGARGRSNSKTDPRASDTERVIATRRPMSVPPINTNNTGGLSPPKKKPPQPPSKGLEVIKEGGSRNSMEKKSKEEIAKKPESQESPTLTRDIASPGSASPISAPRPREIVTSPSSPERKSWIQAMGGAQITSAAKNIGQMFKRSQSSINSKNSNNSLKEMVTGKSKPAKRNDLAKEADIDDHESSDTSSGSDSDSESSVEDLTTTENKTRSVSATHDDSTSATRSETKSLPMKSASARKSSVERQGQMEYPSDMIMSETETEPTDDQSTEPPLPKKAAPTNVVKAETPPFPQVPPQAIKVISASKETLPQKEYSAPVSLKGSNPEKIGALTVPTKSLPSPQKPSEDSFDVSELSEDWSEDSRRLTPKTNTSSQNLIRKSTGEIAASALKPLSRTGSKRSSTQSVNFKLKEEENDQLPKKTAFGSVPVIAVTAKPIQTTETEVSELISSFTDSDDSRDAPPKAKSTFGKQTSSIHKLDKLVTAPTVTKVQAKTNRHHDLDEFDIDSMSSEDI